MNSLFLTRKRSVITALAAVACFSSIGDVCAADEAVDSTTKQKSPRTVIAAPKPPVARYRIPLRLATGAAARGWLGRMPARRHVAKPESLIPPPAPLLEPVELDRMPVPVPPAAIHRSEEIATPLSLRYGTALPPTAVSEPPLPKALSVTTQPLNVTPVSQSTELDIPEQKTDVPEEASAIPAASDLDQLLHGRSLGAVSLFMASESETLSGEALKTPDDLAGQIMTGFGVYHDLPAVRAGRFCRNSQVPLFMNPLYFEDPNLERCGQGHGCFTELVSAVRFFGRVPLVPYMMGANPPLSCVPSLGDCPACHSFGHDAYLPPCDRDATALQTACTVGLIFLLP